MLNAGVNEMIAFRTYADNPTPQPVGFPLTYPWQMQVCQESEVETLEDAGFTIMSNEDFTTYLAAQDVLYADYLATRPQEVPASISLRQLLLALQDVNVGLEVYGDSFNVTRSGANVAAIMSSANLTETDMDDVFVNGATL